MVRGHAARKSIEKDRQLEAEPAVSATGKGEGANEEELPSVEPTTTPAKWIKAVEDKVAEEQEADSLPNLEEQQLGERMSKREGKQRLAELMDQRQAGTISEEEYKAQKRVLLQATNSSG